jgi:hypothetical protein
MKPKERLAQLIEEGGVIHLLEGGSMELTLAGALWLTKPTRLRWVAIFPEHQGHIHELGYTEATLDNDGRDVLFYRGAELVATVVPYVEAGLLDIGEVRLALAEWQSGVTENGNEEALAEFLATA